ncbi:hypothetical protein BDR05DRAFT_638688 [Suillus weaverae]|nr:hypothetical protein BDR05DRAFT_638688 [Suillus weaverae]
MLAMRGREYIDGAVGWWWWWWWVRHDDSSRSTCLVEQNKESAYLISNTKTQPMPTHLPA